MIKSIEHTWRARSGETMLIYFCATDSANVFELRFNLKTTERVLGKVYIE